MKFTATTPGAALIIFLAGFLHISFITLRSAKLKKQDDPIYLAEPPANTAFPPAESALLAVYDSLQNELTDLNRVAFEKAIAGYTRLLRQGKIQNNHLLTIIDFSQPSTRKRLYVIDLHQPGLLIHTLAAHGRNSGKYTAVSFSNRPESYKSSPGFYLTGETYYGKNGYSLRLDGLNKGINDKALQRGIVLHGAAYVSETLAATQGYIGRSQGCPAVPLQETNQIIRLIKNGSLVYIYHPDWAEKTRLVN